MHTGLYLSFSYKQYCLSVCVCVSGC